MRKGAFFHTLRSAVKGKDVIILTHHGADVDALASAEVLRAYLCYDCKAVVGVPGHANSHAQLLAKNLDISFIYPSTLEKYQAAVFVDLNDSRMLGERLHMEVSRFRGQRFMIDHHKRASSYGLLVPHEHALVDENASSTAELIYLMLKEAKQPVDARISTLLACGILADSSYFSNSRPETFVAMGELMHVSNKDVQQMFSLFETPMSIAEKIALLKAARRTKIYRHENFLIVTSHVGAYEAHAASALVLMGADVAFVAAPGKSHTIISARASQQASRMGIDLVDSIFTKLSDDFPGSGGGHRAAAAFTSPSKEYETMLERCVGLVAEALGWETTKLERVD